MKAKDLMIGDWVKDLTENRYDRIEDVESRGRVFLENSKTYLFDDEIEFVPITREVLEKNGFNPDGTINYLHEIYEAFIIEEDKYDGYLSANGELGIFLFGKYHICDIRYVHELQHVLRVIEINKEITI